MVAIVTGASSGIGEAVCFALLRDGYEVVGIGGKNPPKHATHKYCYDVRDEHNAIEAVDAALDVAGHINVLVNCAGVLVPGFVETTSDDDWAYVLDVNLSAAFRFIRAAAPHLRKTKGAIVNVSSINAYRPFRGTTAYSVSKAGLDQLTRQAAVELAPDVRVNAVNPGVVVTDLHRRGGMSSSDYTKFLKRSDETHPLGRPGQPEDVASAVMFLATHEWITGVCLPVDGGRHLTVLR